MQLLNCLFAACCRLLLLLPYLAVANNYPVANPPRQSNICMEQLTTHEGLSQNTIRCLMQDRKGFIWIGTLNGLNRYDGRKFIVYRPEYGNPHSISDNRIKELQEDRYGFIWIKTFEGRYHCFDPVRENYIAFAQEGAMLPYDQLFQASSGDIWLYGRLNGCLRIRRQEGRFRSTRLELPGSPHINFIFEDVRRQLWAGTSSGLYQLDQQGRVLAAYRNRPRPGGEGANFIQAIAGNGQLYFLTSGNGVFRYQLQQGSFSQLPADRALQLACGALLPDGRLLLGTRANGAYVLHLQQGVVQPAATVFGKAINGRVDIVTDKARGIWVNNHTGEIWYYDAQRRKARHFTLIPPQVMQLIDDGRYTFHSDSQGNTWITTYGGGLYCYSPQADTLRHFAHAGAQPNGLSSNYLLSVLEDRSGLIWVGTEHTGLNKLIPQSLAVSYFYPDEQHPARYTANIVKTLFEDSRGNIWVGTKNGSLTLYNSRLGKVRSLEHLFPQQGSNVYCIQEDARGYIWIGTKGQGLFIAHVDSLHRPARHFTLPRQENGDNMHNLVYTIACDRQQRMWIGTFGGGLNMAVYRGGKDIAFRHFFSNNETLAYIRCLLPDRNGRMWTGTNNGLLVFDPDSLLQNENAFRIYQSDLKDPGSLANNAIKTICQDHKGRIWVGTTGGGFSRFVPASGKQAAHFRTYTSQHGLSNDIVNGMLEDAQGNLWISTENGLTRYNPEKSTFEIFYFSSNTLGNLFTEAAYCKRRNGQQLWGSLNGFYGFYPERMRNDSYEAPVVLTGFSIAGNPVRVGAPNAPLQESVSSAREIRLEPGQKVFSIEFASLAYRNPQKNKYTYILENYEDEWNTPASYNIATYRNLPPGKYTFRVRGTNNDGTWSKQEASIRVVVLPPFWRSHAAFVLYAGIITMLVLGIRAVRKRIFKLQQAVELEKQLTEYKLNFFTDISHEFRTPLSLIMSAMESLTPGRQPVLQAGRHLYIMQRNVQRLMRLVDQLLDFRKIQHQHMKLQLLETDVITLLRNLCYSFHDLAEQKQIHLQFESNVEEYTMWVDDNKLDKMMYNLLSNAHKFTPAGGTVRVRAEVDEAAGQLRILVSDSGIAIPEARRHLIFQRFTQLSFSPTGTGIGLSLTKELVELHKGEINFYNNPDAGVTFTISLPLSKDVYAPEELAPADTTAAAAGLSCPLPAAYIPDADSLTLPEPASRYKVLVIEDNPDICDYLAAQLGQYFHVHTANNGRDGLAQAIELSPDLVVCDVMLPEMNGFDITRRIRSEFQTCHIPVVLLTALSSGEHQLQGIDAGADAYIAKPFSTRFLLTNIIRIIEQREKIRKRFSNDPGFFEVNIDASEADRKFLDRINGIIEKNLDNTAFSVDDFAAAVKLGRTLFYKKVKGLTGYSPNEYIRLVRLKKAAELLNTGDYTVAEVTYKVGMNDPFYFSKCFKAQFGIPPSAYLKRVKAG